MRALAYKVASVLPVWFQRRKLQIEIVNEEKRQNTIFKRVSWLILIYPYQLPNVSRLYGQARHPKMTFVQPRELLYPLANGYIWRNPMKCLFYLDTFSISDHHSPENFHSREAIDIGVVRSFLQPTFSLGTNTSCQYWPNILSAYYAKNCGGI